MEVKPDAKTLVHMVAYVCAGILAIPLAGRFALRMPTRRTLWLRKALRESFCCSFERGTAVKAA